MPVMNGWEFLDSLKTIDLSKHIMFHICSSSISPLDIERAKEYSMVDRYIVKPINIGELKHIMDQYLNLEAG